MSNAKTKVLRRAEAKFTKKENRQVDGAKAMAEYQDRMDAVRAKTVRLRALRLARDASQLPTLSSQPAGHLRGGNR